MRSQARWFRLSQYFTDFSICIAIQTVNPNTNKVVKSFDEMTTLEEDAAVAFNKASIISFCDLEIVFEVP